MEKKKMWMTNRVAVILGLTLTISLALSALSLAAEDEPSTTDGLTGTVTFGAELVDLDNDSFKYGEYNGVVNDGTYFLGNADLSYNTGAYYLDFRAEDIGLKSRDMYLEGGRYGRYRLYLEVSELSHYISNSSSTPFVNAGNENLTLPAGFVRGFETQDMSTLNSSLRSIDLKLRRSSGSAGFTIALGSNLDFRMSAKREEKDGKKSIGGTIGEVKANARTIVLPEPVDYTTDELRTQLSYAGEKAQAQLEYYLSSFDNKKESLAWENPFDVADDPATGRMSLPPDNRYHKVSLSGGLNLPYFTRVAAIAEYGKMEQDETLLAYSNNPATVITTPLPRKTADAEKDLTNFTFNISSKPLPRLGLNARYRYYKTENKTPRDLFQYVRNDTGAQASEDNSWALYNLPYDYTQNQLRLDGSYSFTKRSIFKLGYDRDIMDRDYRAVKETKEDTYKTGLVIRPWPGSFASIDYAHSSRKIDGEYDESRVFDNRHSDAYIAYIDSFNPELHFDNNPYLRMYDVANRDRNKYVAKVSFSGLQNASAGLTYSHWKDDYTDSILGLTESKNGIFTVDVSFSPAESILLTVFYTREDLTFMQTGRDLTMQQQYDDASWDWSAEQKNGTDTAGIGANIGLLDNKLTIAADYSYTQSKESISFATGSAFSSSPVEMPDLKTSLNKIKVSGKYNIDANLSIGLGYEFEDYSSDNWSTDNVNPGSMAMADALTLSGSTADYKVHLGMIYLTYKFGS